MITLYSTNCPKCRALAKQLDKNKIEYEVVTDRDLMISKGINSAPQLEINGKMMDYSTAVRWAMNGGKNNEEQ